MGFFDILGDILSSAAKSTANSRAKAARDYERKNPNMSSAQREKLEKFNKIRLFIMLVIIETVPLLNKQSKNII